MLLHQWVLTISIFGSPTTYIKDEEKRIICKQVGITLLEIPYWWDEEKESIREIIRKYRPDIPL